MWPDDVMWKGDRAGRVEGRERGRIDVGRALLWKMGEGGSLRVPQSRCFSVFRRCNWFWAASFLAFTWPRVCLTQQNKRWHIKQPTCWTGGFYHHPPRALSLLEKGVQKGLWWLPDPASPLVSGAVTNSHSHNRPLSLPCPPSAPIQACNAGSAEGEGQWIGGSDVA